MGLLEKTIEQILSVRTDIQLKALAIIIFAIIAIMMCMPIASGRSTELSAQQLGVIFLCVAGIIVVILSDRIVSLSLSQGKLNIKLAEIKDTTNEIIKEVEKSISKERPPPPPPFLAATALTVRPTEKETAQAAREHVMEAKELVSKQATSNRMDDMLNDAENIGIAMGMLLEVVRSYELTQTRSKDSKKESDQA